MFSISAEFKTSYVLLNHLVQFNLLILWIELYNFLKGSSFVRVNDIVYLFIQFVRCTEEEGVCLDQSSSKIELVNNPFKKLKK